MISDAIRAGGGREAYSFPRRDARDILSLLALVATFVAVLGLFAVSPIELEARGIAYIDAGGGLFSKFHPATVIALSAFVLRCLAARRPMHVAWRLTTGDTGVLLLLASVVVAAIFAVIIDKVPVTPLVDTFVLPPLIFVLLRDLDRRAAALLAALLAAILVVNAGLAILEYLCGFHLIQVDTPPDVTDDPTKANAVFSWKADIAHDWRAQALLGHPLVNGLIVGSLAICLVSPGAGWIPVLPRVALLGLQIVSLFSFGARTSLVLTVVIVIALVVMQTAGAMGRGARLTPRASAWAVVALAAGAISILLLFYSGFLDKTIDRFGNDSGSATTRVTMFALFGPISLPDLFLHPDKDYVATLQRIYGLEFGIESSWIGLALTYGFIVTAMLTAGILAFWRSVLLVSGRGAFAVCVYYFVAISVTASLSGKTTTMAMVVALVVLFLRNDAPSPRRRDASIESDRHGSA